MIDALLPLGLLIVVCKLVEGMFERFGLNSIVAYTITGTLLGPVLNIIEPTRELQTFLGIGIFVFFFLVGLDEIDIPSFVATIRGRFFVAATVSVLISLIVALVLTSNLFQHQLCTQPQFHGGTGSGRHPVAVQSGTCGKGARRQRAFQRTHRPRDIYHSDHRRIARPARGRVLHQRNRRAEYDLSVASVLLLLIQIAGFAVVAWFLSARILPHAIVFLQRILNVPELSFGLLIGGLFLMVVGAEKIHLHGSIGALLFGAALSGLPHQVHEDVMPGLRSAAEGMFVPLFFASAGLYLDLSFTTLPIATIVALVVFPSLGKFAGAFIGTYIARLDNPLAQSTGLMAKGVAEIALLLVLFENGVIGQDVFSLFVLMMFGYIVLMPQAIDIAVDKAKKSHRPSCPTPCHFLLPARRCRTLPSTTSWTERAPMPTQHSRPRILSMTGPCPNNRIISWLMTAL